MDDPIVTDKVEFGAWARNVWQVVQEIPRGCVLTYGEVARLAGPGGSARRVSLAMRLAPRGVKLPWHRVINSRADLLSREASYRQQKSS
jgi:methylated-DNA-protein-cysteine methyltransferase-like protein